MFPGQGRVHGAGAAQPHALSVDAETELLSAALGLKTSKIKLWS